MAANVFIGETPRENEIFGNVFAKNKIINEWMTAILMLSVLILLSSSCSADVVVSPPNIDQTNHYPGDVVNFNFNVDVRKMNDSCASGSCALDVLNLNIRNGESMNCNLPTQIGNYLNYNCGGQNISVMVTQSGGLDTILNLNCQDVCNPRDVCYEQCGPRDVCYEQCNPANYGYDTICDWVCDTVCDWVQVCDTVIESNNVYYYLISWQIPCNWSNGTHTIKVNANSGGKTNTSETTFNILFLNCSIDGDMDNDGYNNTCCGGNDCNDNNNVIHPGAIEICDNIDNNCNGIIDEGCDDDNDDYCDNSMTIVGTPIVCLKGCGDCNDNNNVIHPGAIEICDNIDNNCNGQVDEGCPQSCDLSANINTNEKNYEVGNIVKFNISFCSPDQCYEMDRTYLWIYLNNTFLLNCELPKANCQIYVSCSSDKVYKNYGNCHLDIVKTSDSSCVRRMCTITSAFQGYNQHQYLEHVSNISIF